MLFIDGTFGEGGGQILRTSVALSALTAQPITIDGIRGGRAKPGLLRQHRCAVLAAAELCGADVEGAELGSTRLVFRPGALRGGRHTVAVGSAGSAGLVLQTVLPLLLAAEGPSEITFQGGTHNRAAPPAEFLQYAFFPRLRQLGAQVQLDVGRVGFEPAGGGSYRLSVTPRPLEGAAFEGHGPVTWSATVLGAGPPKGVLAREREALLGHGIEQVRVRTVRADGVGNCVLVQADSEHGREVFAGFGRRGVSAEEVVEGVVAEARAWEAHGVPIGEHLADQLILPLWLAGGGRLRTVPPSRHTTTQLAVLQRFTGATAAVEEHPDGTRLTVRR